MAKNFGCSFPGCDRHPSKGDTILRISAKGVPFVGRCEHHYGPGGSEQARQDEAAAGRAIADGSILVPPFDPAPPQGKAE